jgi:PleD family two-component response regulator
MAEEASKQAQPTIERPQGPKVLVIEDDQFLRDMLVDKLVAEGFGVAEAVDGETGMEVLQKEKPKLVLLDIILPGIDGFEVLQRMQKDPEMSKIPILIISNLGAQKDIDKAKELGALDYIIKAHFTPGEIIKKVRQALSQR